MHSDSWDPTQIDESLNILATTIDCNNKKMQREFLWQYAIQHCLWFKMHIKCMYVCNIVHREEWNKAMEKRAIKAKEKVKWIKIHRWMCYVCVWGTFTLSRRNCIVDRRRLSNLGSFTLTIFIKYNIHIYLGVCCYYTDARLIFVVAIFVWRCSISVAI